MIANMDRGWADALPDLWRRMARRVLHRGGLRLLRKILRRPALPSEVSGGRVGGVGGVVMTTFALTVMLSGCATHLLSSDEAARRTYSAQLNARLREVADAAKTLHPVCDAGGDRQGCVAASSALEGTLARLKDTLGTLVVPDSYSAAHRDLVTAVGAELDGLKIRSKAILENDNAGWAKGNAIVDAAGKQMDVAAAEYPK